MKPETLVCGCDPSLARPHPANCSGRNTLLYGHYYSEEEIERGWHVRPVVAGRLWMNVYPWVTFEPPSECACEFCALKRRLGEHEPPSWVT